MGQDKDAWLLATDAGYGFIARLGDMQANKKGGKTVLTVPKGSHVLHPQAVTDMDNALIAVLSNEGRLLLFPAKELPEMPRGKGNKMMSIPSARAAAAMSAACITRFSRSVHGDWQPISPIMPAAISFMSAIAFFMRMSLIAPLSASILLRAAGVKLLGA